MHHHHANLWSGALMAVVALNEFVLHVLPPLVTVAGGLVAIAVQIGHFLLHKRDSDAALAKLKTKLFREWEAARDKA